MQASHKDNVWKQWAWGEDLPEEVTFAESEGSTHICQNRNVLGEKDKAKACRDPVGREERSEQWCVDGRLRTMVTKGAAFLCGRAHG